MTIMPSRSVRLKRRLAGLHVDELHHKPANAQLLSLPSRSVNTPTTNTTNSNNCRSFDATTPGDVETFSSPYPRPEVGIERVRGGCDDHAAGGAAGMTTIAKKKTGRRRWRRRRLLLKETVEGNSTASIPKLTLPPQKA